MYGSRLGWTHYHTFVSYFRVFQMSVILWLFGWTFLKLGCITNFDMLSLILLATLWNITGSPCYHCCFHHSLHLSHHLIPYKTWQPSFSYSLTVFWVKSFSFSGSICRQKKTKNKKQKKQKTKIIIIIIKENFFLQISVWFFRETIFECKFLHVSRHKMDWPNLAKSRGGILDSFRLFSLHWLCSCRHC